jgi:hypothetical protein
MTKGRNWVQMWLLTAALTWIPSAGGANALQNQTVSKPCTADVVKDLLSPPKPGEVVFFLDCSVKLRPTDVITRPIVIAGSAGNGVALDCNGGRIDGRGELSKTEPSTLIIRSRLREGKWDRPEQVTVRNCRILGSAKIYGLGDSGNAPAVRVSSFHPSHTKRAQAAAPRDVLFEKVEFITDGRLPFYVAPGATNVTLRKSRFSGRTQTVAVYLDAESQLNTIEETVFDISTDKRELIAVDGSANNRIVQNTFHRVRNGGIFFYRNCGEAGTIRHQTPHGNIVRDNTFDMNGRKPAIWLNSRNGNSKFCFSDVEAPFGSSL